MAKIAVYQIWAISWRGFPDMIKHLRRIRWLGFTHVYLSAALASPRHDHGFDVSNYMSIDHRIGTMKQFEDFIEEAHRLGLGVLIDLVLNHTSIYNPLFHNHPEYYCRLDHDIPGWQNFFDNGPAWHYDELRGNYYLSSFTEYQADLCWFTPDGDLNQPLVREFQRIVRYWTKQYRVNGFRLDVPQAMNKDYTFSKDNMVFNDALFGDKDEQVINAIFPDRHKAPFLIMECFDPTFGDLVEYYAERTPVNFVMNFLVREAAAQGITNFLEKALHSEENPHFMLHIEDHDSPRFTSWANVSPAHGVWYLLNSQAQAIYMYQGQELGLLNPRLTRGAMRHLDAISKMRLGRGEDIRKLRLTSRANARIPIPMGEYKQQEKTRNSCYYYTRDLISRWYRL